MDGCMGAHMSLISWTRSIGIGTKELQSFKGCATQRKGRRNCAKKKNHDQVDVMQFAEVQVSTSSEVYYALPVLDSDGRES